VAGRVTALLPSALHQAIPVNQAKPDQQAPKVPTNCGGPVRLPSDRRYIVRVAESPDRDQLRTAEVVAALSLATDLGMGLPFEHGLQTTLVAMRMAERMAVDPATARQTYFGCLLFYAGCTADAEVQASLFPEGALLEHWTPVMFGSSREATLGVLVALAAGDGGWSQRILRAAGKLPGAIGGYKRHVAALCEVTQLLAAGFGLSTDITGILADINERWDGRGPLQRLRERQIPLAVRIIHVARDATFQASVRDEGYAARILRERAGRAFDPNVVDVVLLECDEILGFPVGGSLWQAMLDAEPEPHQMLYGAQIDDALLSAGAFADLVSPDMTGHSAAVADLAGRAAEFAGHSDGESTAIRRAGFLQDLGRVGVPFGVWQKPGLNADGWEKIRLHAYHTERVLSRSPYLASLGAIAGCHHERVDGSGYPRGTPAAGLAPPARLLGAADCYCTKTEPRPHRAPLTADGAADHLRAEAKAGHLDPDCVASVLAAAGHRPGVIERPGGLTDRESQTLALLARGMATKQIARILGGDAEDCGPRHPTCVRQGRHLDARCGCRLRDAAWVGDVGELPLVGRAPSS
jgi:HD-GYP domain-containing protein (c-di-GMP phosphodiesterase class II)